VGGLNVADASALFDRRRSAWLSADAAAYLACFTDDLEITVPGRADPIRGIGAYGRLVQRSFAWARPQSFEFHHLAVTEDDVVLAEWSISTERIADGGVSAWRGMSACGLRDDRIAWWRESWDPSQLA
jgi:ketosteroid isomerase-like protein